LQFRHVGSSGLVVSIVGLGCNNFGKGLDFEASRAVIEEALAQGVTLLNTGDTYGRGIDGAAPLSEKYLGQILKRRRHEIVIATKFGNDIFGLNGPDWGARGSRRYIRAAVERSLRMLDTDWIDLYELHNPDPNTPIEETLSVLSDIVHEGKVRYIGASNFTAWQLVDAAWTARVEGFEHFICAENEYSLLERKVETEVIPACHRLGVGLLPYYPLANGLLTGKYRRGERIPAGSRLDTWEMSAYADERRLGMVERIEDFAEKRSLSLLQVAIGGLAANPVVASVIAGATHPYQVRQNVSAAD
jgi:aryl-alcohol dehydrogenase-like predicted oxidoreductase